MTGCFGWSFPECGPFFDFGKYYLGVHKCISQDFNPGDDVIQEFSQFLQKENIRVSDQELADNRDFIRKYIRLELVSMIYGDDEAKKINVENDPLVEKALGSLPQAQELVARAKKYVASKGRVSE